MPAPLAPRPLLFLTPPDSDFARYLVEALGVAERHPEIVRRIDADLDAHAMGKKALRVADARWEANRSATLPGMETDQPPTEMKLGVGRPRTPAWVVYLGLAVRGYQGGFKSCDTETLLLESLTWCVLLANRGCPAPRPGTLADLVNQVSNATRTFVLDAQIHDVLEASWDDFSQVQMDSTPVAGNSQWPNDSRLMVTLVQRVLHVGERLDRVGLPAFLLPPVAEWAKKMREHDKRINLGAGKPGAEQERRTRYQQVLGLARRAHRKLVAAVAGTRAALETLDTRPSQRQRAEHVVKRLQTDVDNLRTVMTNCRARVEEGRHVPMAEKVLSASDADVGFIAKQGRDPVVGYKPQLARSGRGFVVGFELPRGNAADAPHLVPLFEQTVNRTHVIPMEVSVDDGYSSAAGHAEVLGWGVEVVSISGSKGKLITPEEDWESLEYAAARNHRSAVESLMFTIKHSFDFGRVARRGLEPVTAEMLEKILAYNFCRMGTCRRAEQEDRADVLAATG